MKNRLTNQQFKYYRTSKEGIKLIQHANRILKSVSRKMDRATRVRLCKYAGQLKLRGLEKVHNL